tara:strand:- start:267 stop:902 length:636 start_codon:yes stop_codon:yes gene_type:complete
MLKNLLGKIIGNSKLLIGLLIATPMVAVAFIFILSHALFTPKQPSSEEIIQSLASKAKLGGVDLALVGLELAIEDKKSDNQTQGPDYTVTEDGLIVWDEHYYYKIITTFVTNVQSETDTIVRADIAISSYLPSTVGENYQMQMSAFEPMIVSAVLNFLGNMKKTDFIGSENLDLTSNKIKNVINEVLEKQDARYLVDHVYFFELAMNDGPM